MDTMVGQMGAGSLSDGAERPAPSMFADKRDLFERICRARESLLAPGIAAVQDVGRHALRPAVLKSWDRSLRYGLNPRRVAPVRRPDVDLDGQLTRVVDAVIGKRGAVLDQSMCGLSLTDGEGRVLRQWVHDETLGRWLERHDILPTFSVDETVIGTSSGICLLSGEPTLVRGPEHFSEEYFEVTSAGAPLIHPVTRRIIGSLNLTCRYQDTSPVLLAWVMELVADVQRVVRDSATRRERILLDAYLAENRDVRHPLVALNEKTIITNATAARLLGSVDQALLWEHASRAIQQRRLDPQRVVLTDGTVVSVACRQIPDSSETIGAVLKIRPISERPAQQDGASLVAALGGLAGKGPRWRELCRKAQRAVNEWVLVAGERGTGKLAVAKAIAGDSPVQVLDAADSTAVGSGPWLQKLEQHLAQVSSRSVLIIRHVDELDPSSSITAAGLLQANREYPLQVLATTTECVQHGAPSPLQDLFTAIVEVPALRDRREDLPALLDALTAAALARLGEGQRSIHWMPDAAQALTRLDWPGNVASLESLVREVVRGNHNGYINAKDLPPDVVARASRRRLAGLEQVEATAIVAALREAGGNKYRAADALGIARSTLYRKVRALGIDLSTMAF